MTPIISDCACQDTGGGGSPAVSLADSQFADGAASVAVGGSALPSPDPSLIITNPSATDSMIALISFQVPSIFTNIEDPLYQFSRRVDYVWTGGAYASDIPVPKVNASGPPGQNVIIPNNTFNTHITLAPSGAATLTIFDEVFCDYNGVAPTDPVLLSYNDNWRIHSIGWLA